MAGESNPSVDKQLFDLAQGGLSSPSAFEDWTTQYPCFKQMQTTTTKKAVCQVSLFSSPFSVTSLKSFYES